MATAMKTKGQINRATKGLRTKLEFSQVRIYQANPDGSKGTFINTEDGTTFETTFQRRYDYQNHKEI